MKDKSGVTTFISYATKYDLYVGQKDWNQLAPEQQDRIILNEISQTESDPCDYIMECDLKKMQASGLRAVLVHSSMLLEKYRQIKDSLLWDDQQRQKVISFLQGTLVGRRLAEAVHPHGSNEKTGINGKELEALAQVGTTPSILDVTLDMQFADAKSYIFEKLASMPSKSLTKDKNDLELDFEKAWNSMSLGLQDELLLACCGTHEEWLSVKEKCPPRISGYIGVKVAPPYLPKGTSLTDTKRKARQQKILARLKNPIFRLRLERAISRSNGEVTAGEEPNIFDAHSVVSRLDVQDNPAIPERNEMPISATNRLMLRFMSYSLFFIAGIAPLASI